MIECEWYQFSLNQTIFIFNSITVPQGLTPRFQTRGPKRSFDQNQWSKTGFLVVMHTILAPSLKTLEVHSKI